MKLSKQTLTLSMILSGILGNASLSFAQHGVGSSGGTPQPPGRQPSPIPPCRVPPDFYFEFSCRADFSEIGPDYKTATAGFSISKMACNGEAMVYLKNLSWGEGTPGSERAVINENHFVVLSVSPDAKFPRDPKKMKSSLRSTLVNTSGPQYITSESGGVYNEATMSISTDTVLEVIEKGANGKGGSEKRSRLQVKCINLHALPSTPRPNPPGRPEPIVSDSLQEE